MTRLVTEAAAGAATTVLTWLVATVAAFLVGSVNPAVIVARLFGQDLAHSGSGNPGATNVGRLLGLRWGVLVGVLDVAKGFVPVLAAQLVVGQLVALGVGLAVVLGHIWSPFLRGHGGKGVATSLGAILAVQPWFGVVVLVVFGLVLWRTRWVAAASVSAALALIVLGVGAWLGWAPVPGGGRAVGAWCVLVALTVIARHRRNIELWLALRRGSSTP